MPQFHAADVQAPTFPGPILPDNNPPSAQAIRALAHPSAVWNLYRVVHDNVHFEHTTYGDSSPISLISTSQPRKIEVQYPLPRSIGHQYGRSQSSIGGNIVAELLQAERRIYSILTYGYKTFPMPLGSPPANIS
ncbi:hypothetical protein B0H13DRAFT_1876067 [Mycena leptocephala]|nr:hypothetical protein B0H13DRAFT_1876067 [Mycena leptocephala]